MSHLEKIFTPAPHPRRAKLGLALSTAVALLSGCNAILENDRATLQDDAGDSSSMYDAIPTKDASEHEAGAADHDAADAGATDHDAAQPTRGDSSTVDGDSAAADSPMRNGDGSLDVVEAGAPGSQESGSTIDVISDHVAVEAGPRADSSDRVDASADSAEPEAEAPCSARHIDEANGIFVRADGSDTSTCGSSSLACKTIQNGIARAQSLGRSIVFVASGTYVERIVLVAGIRVEGGWDILGDSWVPNCTSGANQRATIQAPSNANMAVVADALAGEAVLASLTIHSKTAGAAESVYGVFARGPSTTLRLEDVRIAMETGGDGADGPVGADAPATSPIGCSSGDGAIGATGPLGMGATVGSFDRTGYVPSDGPRGGDGVPGGNGTAASPPTCVTNCVTCSSCPFAPGPDSCGTAGSAGCGGNVGQGGGGGHGGGSSIGLYAWDAVIEIVGGQIAAGNGGQGGSGGNGGAGAMGAQGSAGQPGPGCIVACTTVGLGTCVPAAGVAGGAAGGLGGNGGNGGNGGIGGGGAGGSSCAVYRGGASSIQALSASLMAGSAGTSRGNGASGITKPMCP